MHWGCCKHLSSWRIGTAKAGHDTFSITGIAAETCAPGVRYPSTGHRIVQYMNIIAHNPYFSRHHGIAKRLAMPEFGLVL